LTAAKGILLTGAGLLLFTLFAKGQQIGKLIFYPGKVSEIDLWPSPHCTLELIVQNTNSGSLQLNSFAGALYAKQSGTSTLIGNVSSFQPVTIAGNSQGLIRIYVKLFALGIVNDIIRAFTTGQFSQEVLLDANANIDNLQLPVSMTFKIGA